MRKGKREAYEIGFTALGTTSIPLSGESSQILSYRHIGPGGLDARVSDVTDDYARARRMTFKGESK